LSFNLLSLLLLLPVGSIKLFQLNIEQGKRINAIMDFIQENDFDVIHFQEVTGGEHSPVHTLDCFDILCDNLTAYHGFLSKSHHCPCDPNSYFGNATFIKRDIEIIDQNIIWMNDFREVPCGDLDFTYHPYSVVSSTLVFNNKKLTLLNGHYTWSSNPGDNELKISRARKVCDYMESLDHKEIIVTGDFNASSETLTVKQFEKFGINLVKQNNITNTLNPRLHKKQFLFPKGVQCDFVFVPFSSKVIEFKMVEDDLSDHFGIYCELYL
jgi:endonuclease/exonuclease/phosphatase family metal-dependent hydrolase